MTTMSHSEQEEIREEVRRHNWMLQRQLREDNRKFDSWVFRELRVDLMKPIMGGPLPEQAFRSREFLVQVFDEGTGWKRMSVNKAELMENGHWKDGTTWEELMRIKSLIGFDDWWGVELLPPSQHTVNVANMRHVWLCRTPCFPHWEKGAARKPFTPTNSLLG